MSPVWAGGFAPTGPPGEARQGTFTNVNTRRPR